MRTQKKEKYIHIRISDSLKSKLDESCNEKSITPSKLIRKMINDYLNDK